MLFSAAKGPQGPHESSHESADGKFDSARKICKKCAWSSFTGSLFTTSSCPHVGVTGLRQDQHIQGSQTQKIPAHRTNIRTCGSAKTRLRIESRSHFRKCLPYDHRHGSHSPVVELVFIAATELSGFLEVSTCTSQIFSRSTII